jgi:hypothetical protein
MDGQRRQSPHCRAGGLFGPDDRALQILATRRIAWRSHRSPFVIPSRRRGISAAGNAGIPCIARHDRTRGAGGANSRVAVLRACVSLNKQATCLRQASRPKSVSSYRPFVRQRPPGCGEMAVPLLSTKNPVGHPKHLGYIRAPPRRRRFGSDQKFLASAMGIFDVLGAANAAVAVAVGRVVCALSSLGSTTSFHAAVTRRPDDEPSQ